MNSDRSAATEARARGCLLGQLVGDAFGSQAEFRTPEQIRESFPDGLTAMGASPVWGTLPGQPTDDSEMALALARTLVTHGRYDAGHAFDAYCAWFASRPFDCGMTIMRGLRGDPNPASQANGALMRISPLGIFGVGLEPAQLARHAAEDARLTHPHAVCVAANQLFVDAIAHAIRTARSRAEVLDHLLDAAGRKVAAAPERADGPAHLPEALVEAVRRGVDAPPDDFVHQQGWVLIAVQNAVYRLAHAPDFATALIDTVAGGGDTDTNAAICGALLGAVLSVDAIPAEWRATVLACRPDPADLSVRHPRPSTYWPTDALALADRLLDRSSARPC